MNHFPATRSALLMELAALRRDITASRKDRARQLAAEQSMIAEAAVIERAVIANLIATEPPNCITADTTGAWWQATGDHLRVVPVADGRKTIAGPVPEPLLPLAADTTDLATEFTVPMTACLPNYRSLASTYAGHKPTDSGCMCRGCRGVATSPFTVPVAAVELPALEPMELTDEGPTYLVRSALDWAANVLDADEIGDDGCGSEAVASTNGTNHFPGDC